MCVVSTTNTDFFSRLFVCSLCFFCFFLPPFQIRLLLLSPSVFVASPPFLLLSASKRCYPVVSFAYRTFDVWPHRRCHVVVFLRCRYLLLLLLLFFAFFRVVRGGGGGGGKGRWCWGRAGRGVALILLLPSPVLSAALSHRFSRRCLCRRYRALRSRWRPPAAATAPRKRRGGCGGGFLPLSEKNVSVNL